MKNLFNLNESEKNRILGLHDNYKLKMFGLIKEEPEVQTTVNEYLRDPKDPKYNGDPIMYLKVGDNNPKYYFKISDTPTGQYRNMAKNPTIKAKWDSVAAKYPVWTPASAGQSAGIARDVIFQTTPVPGGVINKTPVSDPNANPNANQTPDKMQTLKPNQVTSNKGIDPNAQIQRNLDLQTRKDGQINVKDAAKQIKQQDKNAEKLFQQMENDIVKSCLVPVKNIEKSYFGRGIFNRAMKPEQIDQLLKQDKIKQELITNLTELFKKIKVPVGATLLDTGKRCVDYDKVKQQIGKFPNFKPEELAKKVGLDINNLSEKPKNVTPPKAAADEYNKTKGGTSTGGSGMGAMAKSDADFDAMINQGTDTKAPTNVNLTNTAGPVNTNNQPETNTGNEKLNYLNSQLNMANNQGAKPNPNPNEPDEDELLKGTLAGR
jgi:hypothetical protein